MASLPIAEADLRLPGNRRIGPAARAVSGDSYATLGFTPTGRGLVDSVTDQRSAGWARWRGNSPGLGGWTFVTRISLTTLLETGTGFFGLYGSTSALATTLTLAAVINCIGIGIQRGTHTRWQLVSNDGTGAPTMTDMGASFAIATGGVLTLHIAAPPNGSSVRVRVVDEVSGAVFEREIVADRPHRWS